MFLRSSLASEPLIKQRTTLALKNGLFSAPGSVLRTQLIKNQPSYRSNLLMDTLILFLSGTDASTNIRIKQLTTKHFKTVLSGLNT